MLLAHLVKDFLYSVFFLNLLTMHHFISGAACIMPIRLEHLENGIQCSLSPIISFSFTFFDSICFRLFLLVLFISVSSRYQSNLASNRCGPSLNHNLEMRLRCNINPQTVKKSRKKKTKSEGVNAICALMCVCLKTCESCC